MTRPPVHYNDHVMSIETGHRYEFIRIKPATTVAYDLKPRFPTIPAGSAASILSRLISLSSMNPRIRPAIGTYAAFNYPDERIGNAFLITAGTKADRALFAYPRHPEIIVFCLGVLHGRIHNHA